MAVGKQFAIHVQKITISQYVLSLCDLLIFIQYYKINTVFNL